jgi:hypothetical protein
LIFPIQQLRSRTPIISLGGSWYRQKPIIPIEVIGPTGQFGTQISVDSGADDVVFPIRLAPSLGVDLSGGPQRHAGGIGAPSPVGLLYAPVILELSDQIETCRWRATVAFAQTRHMRLPLFGIAGGLEHFLTTLNFYASEIIMVPQPTLPVTQDARP